ncbi:MAG: hypothetical protein KDE27_24935, partial [Planctomycetes bacterium]|nr:hypothetical protein [Planctomycetota bacterium]
MKKEQVLALIALAVGAWIYSGFGASGGGRPVYTPKPLELDVTPVDPAPLVEAGPSDSGRRDLFTQPRETRPLPPRELAFPPQAPATVAALPLPLGPDYRNLVRLAIDG